MAIIVEDKGTAEQEKAKELLRKEQIKREFDKGICFQCHGRFPREDLKYTESNIGTHHVYCPRCYLEVHFTYLRHHRTKKYTHSHSR